MLEIRGLNAWYGESHILHGVDFDVREGEVVTLLGRNGAGKTTTMKSIMGLVPRREGSIKFKGAETASLPPNKIAHAGIAFCPEERGIFGSLSVTENLMLPPVVAPGGLSVDEIYALFPNLKERARTAQGTRLSGGEQQMLAIARILRTGAKMLLLDETTGGLAPVIAQQIARTALALFDATRGVHGLTDREREWLEYAGLMHDLGVHISYPRHHRHSYYLIKNGDLRGFHPDEIEAIALIARYHRRGTPKRSHEGFTALPAPLRRYAPQGTGALRWRRLARGLQAARLVTDQEHGCYLSLLHLEPGHAVPRHTHRGDELVMVLQGGYEDEHGHFGVGDVEMADPSIEHRPVADPGPMCIGLVLAQAPVRLTGFPGRLLNPFLRLR